MLFIENTPRSAGVTVWGDTFTLESIYELSHKLWEVPEIKDGTLQECLMAFSYEIRLCYENARETRIILDLNNNPIHIYGVKINWIELLIQLSFMRFCMGYIDTTKEEQSFIYLLEYHSEKCLENILPKTAKNILFHTKNIPYLDQSTTGEYFDSIALYFLKLNNKRKRESELLKLIKTFNPNLTNDIDLIENLIKKRENLFEPINENISW